MGTASTIAKLPDDIREQLNELLRDPRCSQLEVTARINEMLEEQGVDDRVSKSAVNRYSLSMAEAGKRLTQSREVANMWIGKLGATPQGQLGHLVNEILRTLAFDISLKLQDMDLTEETMPEVVGQLRHLSLVAMRLEKASSENVKREAEIKKQVLAQAAAMVTTAGKQSGISADTVDLIRKQILGIGQ
ncbi:MAG: DUF3486 family protein [Proteobacteria bacterium]|nr:DUF3486 family protein [Pseudomonadota bacterium]MBU1648229.1 DUF3486 family protein [Pseudomonadota bacterium]